MHIDRFNEMLCGVCRRRAIGIGYAPPGSSKPVLWLCDDQGCIETAQKSYAMKQDEFSRIESVAAGKGGEQGGAYLDQIGKTDLAALTQAEWFEFCRRIVAGYRVALATDLQNEVPF